MTDTTQRYTMYHGAKLLLAPLDPDDEPPILPPNPITIGVDVGQVTDATAIVVAESRPDGPIIDNYPTRYRFDVRELGRLPLATKYPDVAARLVDVVIKIRHRLFVPGQTPGRIVVRIDATGVGRPVFDLLVDALRGTGVQVVPVIFNHGEALVPNQTTAGLSLTLGKAFLVSRMQVLIQSGRVTVPQQHPESVALVRELLDYEIRINPRGSDTYGAFRVGTHDDLVTALGLACLIDPVPPQRSRVRTVV